MNTKPPVFLARTGYRRRRAIDAARLFPVVGGILVLLPLLWSGGTTGQVVVFLFTVWIGLIVVAGMLSRVLNRTEQDQKTKPGKGPNDGSV